MSTLQDLENAMPVAPLKLVVLNSAAELPEFSTAH